MKKFNFFKIIFISCFIAAAGFVFISAANSAKAKEYKIGDKGPGGGIIFYDKGKASGGWRYLEVSAEDLGQAVWGCADQSIASARGTSIGSGKNNTKAILKKCKDSGIAARLCAEYKGGGKKDWFLPSIEELDSIFENLVKSGIQTFNDDAYWSSTESSSDKAMARSLMDRMRIPGPKNFEGQVRAIRAF